MPSSVRVRSGFIVNKGAADRAEREAAEWQDAAARPLDISHFSKNKVYAERET
jgi:hypothetical protein